MNLYNKIYCRHLLNYIYALALCHKNTSYNDLFSDILINKIADKSGQSIDLSVGDFDLDQDTMTLLEFCCDLKSDVTSNLWEMMLDCASLEGN